MVLLALRRGGGRVLLVWGPLALFIRSGLAARARELG